MKTLLSLVKTESLSTLAIVVVLTSNPKTNFRLSSQLFKSNFLPSNLLTINNSTADTSIIAAMIPPYNKRILQAKIILTPQTSKINPITQAALIRTWCFRTCLEVTMEIHLTSGPLHKVVNNRANWTSWCNQRHDQASTTYHTILWIIDPTRATTSSHEWRPPGWTSYSLRITRTSSRLSLRE